MFSHQQTEACTATRRPGEKRETGGALVVLVTNYHSQSPQSEDEMRVEEEEEEVADEKDRALGEALSVVVSGWLQEENDLNYNTVNLQPAAACRVRVLYQAAIKYFLSCPILHCGCP